MEIKLLAIKTIKKIKMKLRTKEKTEKTVKKIAYRFD